jgi:aspartate-semialdehyde dehydrogenase
MTRLGILNPTGLVAKELLDRLRPERDGVAIRLLTNRADDLGGVSEVAGEPALVLEATPEEIADLDVLAIFDENAAAIEQHLRHLPESAQAIIAGRWEGPAAAAPQPLVAGVNLEGTPLSHRLLSPDAATIALALALAPLKDHGLLEVTATALESASERGTPGLEEALAQARALLTFQNQPTSEVFGAQVAFNVLPLCEERPETDAASTSAPTALLSKLLSQPVTVELRRAFAGTFHGIALSVRVVVERPVSLPVARQLLARGQHLTLVPETTTAGTIDVAGRDEVLVTGLRQGSSDRVLWLWLLCDNLTRGGAGNLAAILSALLAQLRTEPMVH